MTHASAKRCSCRSGECSAPKRWPPTRPWLPFGRAAARDLVDVAALSELCTLDAELCELAAEKDPGFDRSVFADALTAAAARSDAAFAELGLEPKTVAALRASAARWRALLLDAAGRSAVDALRSFGAPTLIAGPEAPGSTSRPRPSERHRPPPATPSAAVTKMERDAATFFGRRPGLVADLDGRGWCRCRP